MDTNKFLQLNSFKNSQSFMKIPNEVPKEERKKNKKDTYIFKAKSIEKNLDKYPIDKRNK